MMSEQGPQQADGAINNADYGMDWFWLSHSITGPILPWVAQNRVLTGPISKSNARSVRQV